MNAFGLARSGAGLLAAGALLVMVGGCDSARKSIDDNPTFRASAVTSARKSCVQTAESKLSNRPELRPKIESYCDCFATRGMATFSNSELMEVGVRGMKNLTPDQTRKLNQAVLSCEQQAGLK